LGRKGRRAGNDDTDDTGNCRRHQRSDSKHNQNNFAINTPDRHPPPAVPAHRKQRQHQRQQRTVQEVAQDLQDRPEQSGLFLELTLSQAEALTERRVIDEFYRPRWQ
jgi:hypothetical protein